MPNTQNKRRAVAGHKAVPDGVIGALDRRQIAGHYPFSGVPASGFVVDGGNVVLLNRPETRTVVLQTEPKERNVVLQFTKG